MENKQISIIIPAYDEETKIAKCLKKTIDVCEQKQFDYEIIVAEDGSQDNTVQIVQDFIIQNKNIKLITSKNRLGKGLAITNAMFKAKKKFVGFMDADLAGDPVEFEVFLNEMSDNDIVVGSRILRGDLSEIKRPFYRTLFSYAYSKFFRVLFRNPIYDPQCGMKLFRQEIVHELFSQLRTTSFAFDSEVIVKAYSQGLRIKEIPINWNHDNVSKISVMRQIREMGQDLLSIWYEAHLLWLENKKTYPQKKGSLIGRLLFWFLSLYKKPRELKQNNDN